AGAEGLRLGLELDVDFEAYHHLVTALSCRAHECASAPSALSSACAAPNIRASSKCAAMNWPPAGILPTRPIGIEIAGMPARFAVQVKMSLRYISYGSFFEPKANAVVGVVGVKSTCTPLAK